MSIFHQIKSQINCVDYANIYMHRQVPPAGGRCQSFRPGANNPTSLLIAPESFKDWGDGKWGDVIDLCAEHRFNGDKKGAVEFLAKEFNIPTYNEPQYIFTVRKLLDKCADFWHESLTPEAKNYLTARGISEKTIAELKIGWALNPVENLKGWGFTMEEINKSGVLNFCNRIMFPYTINGHVVYFTGRKLDGVMCDDDNAKYKKLSISDYVQHTIWGLDAIDQTEHVYVAEGIMDALSVRQSGLPVITPITGAFSKEQKQILFSLLKDKYITVCLDHDPVSETGQKASLKLAEELLHNGIKCKVVLLGEVAEDKTHKLDLSDIYAKAMLNGQNADKLMHDVLARGKDYILFKLHLMMEGDQEAAKKRILAFFRSLRQKFPVIEIIGYLNELSAFPKQWVAALAKEINRTQSEMECVDKLNVDNTYRYIPGLGIHKYQTVVLGDHEGGYWKQLDETFIKKDIVDYLAEEATYRKVQSIYGLLEAKTCGDGNPPPFDYLNMQNGMLNISSGELADASRSYYINHILPYSYDPSAKCPLFMDFLDKIMIGRPGLKQIIQQMFGYCLTTTTAYEKSFLLIGEGSNGKSTLIKTLESMLGKDLVSHVSPDKFTNDFHLIALYGKRVNLCTEIKTSMKDCETVMKAIASGDTIRAGNKFQANIDFKPTCKLVFALNNHIVSSDSSHGFERKMVYIPFDYRFPEAGGGEETIVDFHGRLLPELPGILNWSMQGLQMLQERGGFVLDDAASEKKKEAMRMNNPMMVWADDMNYNPEKELGKNEVYHDYTSWCESNRVMPFSSTRFWVNARRLFNIEEWNGANGRTVRLQRR